MLTLRVLPSVIPTTHKKYEQKILAFTDCNYTIQYIK